MLNFVEKQLFYNPLVYSNYWRSNYNITLLFNIDFPCYDINFMKYVVYLKS